MELSLRREDFSELPGWADDRPAAAFAAFRRSAGFATKSKPYRSGSLGLNHEDFGPAFAAALAEPVPESGYPPESRARSFFETWFRPVAIGPDENTGLVTGYYEPEVEVSERVESGYRFPFLRKPPNLLKVPDPDNPPAGIPADYAFMLDDLTCCPDRQAIECGAFDGQGLEIAFAKSRTDVFFAHVQGCARLRFPDGRVERITYAAKSGHPFTGIGGLLVKRGEIAAGNISMASIRKWLADHPDQADGLMWENRSFIFFENAAVENDYLGPVAAAKVPLEPGRSLAVDKRIHTFGTPIFVNAPGLQDFDEPRPFARLMIAQDTGTAIVGPARGDLFAGCGFEAGEKAGSIKAAARFVILAPAGSDLARRAGHER
ncbi:membrane-bound lytic murein transglycosylase A [Hoeflea halophila]|uniref:peptidoglycan lytic exotransglycosylase n=1 Tax=Hoeflea halophila TaxID=714899 RepID=A0A286IA17_9HYPH|nr:MltA domain-containing protein [Hoeflea halophila]SOE16965.1 membrane-bound lytic murein transglycosylase A [Hoeflea halophila]